MNEQKKTEDVKQSEASEKPVSQEAKQHEEPKEQEEVSVEEKVVEKIVEVHVDYKDRYLRLVAEFDNARKRMDREKQDFVKFANEGIMSQLLQVVDHLELSVQSAQANPEDTKNLLKGLEMVLANAKDMLKRNGVKAIHVKGEKFDPNKHEILQQEPSEEEEGKILEELQRGYMFHDRVLRTSKVKVAAPEASA